MIRNAGKRGVTPLQMLQAKEIARVKTNEMRRDVFGATVGIMLNVLTAPEYIGHNHGMINAMLDEIEILFKHWEDGNVTMSDVYECVLECCGRETISRWANMFKAKTEKIKYELPSKKRLSDAELMGKTKKEMLEYIRKLEDDVCKKEKRIADQSKRLQEVYNEKN